MNKKHIQWTCGHNDREEDEAKMGFIFQINEYGFGTQLHEEKGQRRDLTTLTTTPFILITCTLAILHSFSVDFLLSTCDSSFEVGLIDRWL